VRLDHCLGDGQTEPDSAMIIAACLPEILEEMLDIARRNSRPAVGDMDCDLIAVRRGAQRYVAVGR
jgi:hypothetical protein